MRIDNNLKVTLIEAPIAKGSPTDGSQYAYRALWEGGLPHRFVQPCLAPMTPPPSGGEVIPQLKYLREVMTVSRRLAKSVEEAIRADRLPIVIGGDHSVAIGSIGGAASVVGASDLAVVYIDGHTDINTEKTTETGFIHGMPLAAAMGLCDDRLTVGSKVNLYGKNTYILGARSIDDGEYPIIEEQGVTLVTAAEIQKRGMAAVIAEILPKIKAPYIHLSFDVDVLDREVFPSTGYLMPDGLSFEEVSDAIAAVFATGKVVSFDCVEYNPLLDKEGKDKEKLFSLFDRIVSTVSSDRKTL